VTAQLDRRLATYALAAGAGVLALGPSAAASDLKANVVYHAANITIGDGFGVAKIDFNNDGIPDINLSMHTYRGGYEFGFDMYQKPAAGNAALLGPRLAGAVIGPSVGSFRGWRERMAFVGESCKTYCGLPGFSGPWVHTGDGFLGVRFLINGETHYGWVRISATAGPKVSLFATITGYAYNTVANQGLVMGVPGPQKAAELAGLGALSLGAGGLELWRRK
jgi:hypothetical protein